MRQTNLSRSTPQTSSFTSKKKKKMMEQVIQTENTKDVFSTGIDKVKNVLE